MKRFLKILTAALAVILLFTTCKQFLEDPEDFFGYWANAAFVKGHSIVSAHRPDGEGVQCVGSSGDAVIALRVHNPKGFLFVIPTSLEPADIVEFKELSEQPTAGTDYELKQIGSGTLQLIYKPALLQKYEHGSAGLNPTITLKTQDGRVFKQTYTFGIKSNTPPPKPKEIIIAKTKTDSHYVLCFKFDSAEMARMVTVGSGTVPIHKDIANISINGSSYSLLYKEDNSDFQKPDGDSFVEYGNVEKLTSSSPDLPSGAWVLYFKTDVKVESSNPQTSYTITLRDKKGVVSDSLTAELKEKFKVEFDVQGGSPVSAQYIEKGGKVTEPSPDPIKAGYTFGGWYTAPSYSTLWDFANNTVTGNITLYAKWTEAGDTPYTVQHYQQNIDNDNYPASPADTDNLNGTTGANAAVTLKTYPGFETGTYTPATIAAEGNTVVKVYYKRKQITVTFNLNGGNIGGNTANVIKRGKYGEALTAPNAELTGHTFSGWNPPLPAGSTFPATDTIYNAQWNLNSYTVTYRVETVDGEPGGTIEAGTSGQTMTGGTVSVTHGGSVTFTGRPATGDWKVAGWTVSSGSFESNPGTSTTATLSNVTSNGITVTVKFYQSTLTNPATWRDLARAVKSAPDGAVITIDGEIKATDDEGNKGIINIEEGKKLTIKGKGSSAVLNANGKSSIFDVSDILTLENITLKKGAAFSNQSGGAGVYVNGNGTLIMKGSSAITGCSAANYGGGVYVSGTFEMHDTSAITGCTADKDGGGVYVSGGTFKMQGLSAITGCEAIGNTGTQEYGEGGGVYNKGSFEITGGEIKNNKARVGGGIYNCHKLILTNATLTGNTATFIGGALCMSSSDSSGKMTGGKIINNECSGSSDGGGVYIHAGTFTLKSGAFIEGNTADYGGGAYVGQNGTLIINGGSIKLNKASRGGGVYVSGNSTKRGTLRMIQGDISDNGAGWNGTSYTGTGGGVYNSGVFEMTGGEIKDNKAETGGGVYFSEGTFEMKGSAVVTPATGSEANSKGKNDVYLVTGQTITVNDILSNNPAARITVPDDKYDPSTQVLDGSTVGTHYTKFTVTPDVKEEGIAQTWTIDSTGKLEKSNMEVRYDRLQYYLTTSSHAVAEDGIYRFKITGSIPPEDLRSNVFKKMGKLARTIQNSHKNVALILPDSIPELGGMYQCFYGCEYLVSLENIPSGVTSIQECFHGCKNLTKAPVIPDSVTDMEHCFDGCTALTQAPTIHPGVTNMKWCFQDCKALISAPVIPQGVTDIYSCFQGCENLTQVPNIPSSVTGMGQCFKYCAALTDGPDIHSNVENMWQCFEGCANLRGLKLMCAYSSGGTFFKDVFAGCTALKTNGIKVPSKQLQTYKNNAGHMGTTADKFSAL